MDVMKRHIAAATFALVVSLCVAHAQQPDRRVAITPIGPLVSVFSPEYFFAEVYFLSNGGANALCVVTDDGAVLIDSKLAGWAPAVLEALQRVSDAPVTTIINTHAHDDHAGANGEYPGTVQILAHENTSKRFAKSAGPGKTVKTFGDHMTLTAGKRALHIYHFGKGHTDGDAIVSIPDAHVAFVGDLFTEKAVPVIDRASGGSALALPETLARATKEITGIEYAITGHGPAPQGRQRNWPTWNEFREYADFTRDFVAAATAAWKNGRTVEQAAAELTLPDRYKNYRLDGAKATIEIIYDELKQAPGARR
jgi:glyoxylase-like metal-dependent hydrolase (beta-lactamase superfamily II)